MAEWIECTIGDLCDSVSEKYCGKHEYVVLINTSDVLEGNILNHKMVKNENLKGQFKKTFKKNDILYSEIRPANKRFAFIDDIDTSNYIASTKLMVLRNNEKILPEFLFILLKSKSTIDELQHLAETRSGTFPQITFLSELSSIKVKLPDKQTQKKIVEFIMGIENKITINNDINNNLEQQARAVFSSYYDNSQEQQLFTSLISVLGGGTPKTGNADFWGGSIPFFTPKDINLPYTFKTEKYITKFGLENCNSRLYPKNTSFVTARGTVGKVSLAGMPMAINQSCYALLSEKIDPVLVYFYTLKVVDSLKHKASGAIFDAIVTRDFDSEIINIISESNSKTVLSIISPLMETIYNNIKENTQLLSLRDVLLPKLMSGELDVSDIDL